MSKVQFIRTAVAAQIAVECDSASSLSMEVEFGGIALLTPVFKRAAGTRLHFRPLTGTTDAPPPSASPALQRAA
jgi:hypothetical protein